MITKAQIPMVLDHPVHDAEGHKIGKTAHVFLDDASGQPEWISVKTGLLGSHETFIPIHDAKLVRDHLEVPFPKTKIKEAPHVNVEGDGHLSAREERRLYDYYGIDWHAAWRQGDQPRSGTPGTPGTTGGAAGRPSAAAAAGTAVPREPATPPREGTLPRETMPREQAAGRPETRPGTGRPGEGYGMTRSEERMKVATELRESGRARLHKYVVTEAVEQTVPLRHEEAHLVREPIREADRAAALRGGEAISEAEQEIILHEEKPVVRTEVVPVERVRLEAEERIENETVRGQVRKERIEAELPSDHDRLR